MIKLRLFCCLIAVSALATVSSAQQVDTVFHKTIPELNGHTFVPSILISGPFINSSFSMGLGVESTTNLTFPRLGNLPDSIKGIEGNLLFITLGFDYHQRIKDWIGFYLSFDVSVRSGTELRSLLAEGVNTVYGGETGVVFRLLQSEKSMLSGRVTVNNYEATILNIRQFVEDIIEGKDNPSISENAPALSAGIGMSFAHAFTQVTGITATGDLHYGESIARGEESARFRIGVAGDFNWASKGVPIGLSLSYLMRSTADYVYVDKELAHTFSLKVAYTAAPDFVIGLHMSNSFVPIISLDEKVNSVGAMLHMVYYFN